MAASYLNAALGKIQTYLNTIGADSVHAAARVEVGTDGVAIPKMVRKKTVTPSIDTSAYAAGDVFFDTTAITSAVLSADQSGLVVGAKLLVKSDVAFGCRIILMNANTSIGTFNAVPDPTDTEGEDQGHDFLLNQSGQVDMGAYRTMTATGLYIPVYPASGTTTIYVAGVISEGTPTFAASSCILTLDII
jgi:hypothetical protein